MTCLSLGDTSIDAIVVGVEFVVPDTFTALKGVVDASVSNRYSVPFLRLHSTSSPQLS